MGIQKWGAFGGFQKKTGPLVGHWLNGQNVITPLPHPSQEPPTTDQLSQRSIFSIMIAFFRILKVIIRTGFTVHKQKESPWSAALGYNLKNSVAGVAPNFTIDYAKVLFSKGDLSNPINFGVAATVSGELTYTWDAFVNPESGDPTDQATFVVYCALLDAFVTVAAAADRSELTYELSLPTPFSGETVQCWACFTSVDKKRASDTVYLGSIVVT
ncbi:MAG: hypothetical protein EOO92_26300 [Pedobacter sp.]|nr:MAG: hypothetical protein EOO92_26300 [Pedobacter sp.]